VSLTEQLKLIGINELNLPTNYEKDNKQCQKLWYQFTENKLSSDFKIASEDKH